MGILDKSDRIESGRHSKLYYGLKDFGNEIKDNTNKIIAFFFVVGLLYMCNYYHVEIENGINGFQEFEQMKIDTDQNVDSIVKSTNDCVLLQQNILALISSGANAESWLPNLQDSDLKIGHERYSILGCKP